MQTDGRGNATTNAYDLLGRLASVTDPLGATTHYAYDAAGNLASAINALGVARVYEYDIRGNKIYEGGGTYPVSYAYDAYGAITNMTTYREGGPGFVPAAGDTTTWIYDEATGLLTSKLYPDGNGPAYTYTIDGKPASRTWARGVVTEYTYDAWGNVQRVDYSDTTPSIVIDYDSMGRETNITDAAGTTAVLYDPCGAVANETVTGALGTKSISRFYDTFGRKTVSSSGALSLVNPYRFSSEYADDTLGLVYYNYRHYNPLIGRWTGRDPLQEYATRNLYCFSNTAWGYDIIGLAHEGVVRMSTPADKKDCPESVYLFIGGALDSRYKPLHSLYRTFLKRHVALKREAYAYYHHDSQSEIVEDIRGLLKCCPDVNIIVIGHSWGGGTALRSLNAINRIEKRRNIAITLDPVSWRMTEFPRDNIGLWINAYVSKGIADGLSFGLPFTPTAFLTGMIEGVFTDRDFSDTVAATGSRLAAEDNADINIRFEPKNATHAMATALFYLAPDGYRPAKSGMEIYLLDNNLIKELP